MTDTPRHALADWDELYSTRDDEKLEAPIVRAPQGPPMAITTHYVGRPQICNGGLATTGRYENGRLVTSKVSRCDNAPDWRTGLCDECQRRESDVRQRLRDSAAGSGRSGSNGYE